MHPRGRSALWLRNAAIGLCALAAAAAAVSFTAAYRMVDADRHLAVVAGLEAAIPDAAALGRLVDKKPVHERQCGASSGAMANL